MNKKRPAMLFDGLIQHDVLTQLCLSAWRMARVVGMRKETEKPLRKCSLKGCDTMHSHNGGYCCAEHSRMADNKVVT